MVLTASSATQGRVPAAFLRGTAVGPIAVVPNPRLVRVRAETARGRIVRIPAARVVDRRASDSAISCAGTFSNTSAREAKIAASLTTSADLADLDRIRRLALLRPVPGRLLRTAATQAARLVARVVRAKARVVRRLVMLADRLAVRRVLRRGGSRNRRSGVENRHPRTKRRNQRWYAA